MKVEYKEKLITNHKLVGGEIVETDDSIPEYYLVSKMWDSDSPNELNLVNLSSGVIYSVHDVQSRVNNGDLKVVKSIMQIEISR